MTDDSTTDATDESTHSELELPGSTAEGSVSADGSGHATASDRSLVEYLEWAVFAILVLVLLIATLQFYTAASATINTFVTPRFRPPFKMAFNLAIVLAAGLGLSVLVRRMQ